MMNVSTKMLRWILLCLFVGALAVVFYTTSSPGFGKHWPTSLTDLTVLATKEPERKVRLLCFVKTAPPTHQTKAVLVQETWGQRFDKLLFVTEKVDSILHHEIIFVNVTTGREHLTTKVLSAFKYIYKYHFDSYDWFMQADDDTYVIVENLRSFLSTQDPESPIYFGHAFKVLVPQGYTSGGAGYVLSKEALRRFGQKKPEQCEGEDGAVDDVIMGRCLENLGVKLGDSRDEQGRSRFHCFDPMTHVTGGYPDWYLQYDKYGAKKGAASVSNHPISFHYVVGDAMRQLEFMLYHIRPHNSTKSQASSLIIGHWLLYVVGLCGLLWTC